MLLKKSQSNRYLLDKANLDKSHICLIAQTQGENATKTQEATGSEREV